MNPIYPIIAVRTAQAGGVALLAHLFLRWPLGLSPLGLGLTAGLCAYFPFVFAGEWTAGLPITKHLPPGENGVALTFDDGPSDTTTRILDILRERDACASFFVLGERARERPDLVRRIVDEGHALCLHGFAHTPYVLMNSNSVRRDVDKGRAAVHGAASHAAAPLFLRPPHGFKTCVLPFWLRGMGLQMAAWSVNSRDYAEADPARIAERVVCQARPRAIVLMHDGSDNGPTADALPRILDGLAARGLPCVLLTTAKP